MSRVKLLLSIFACLLLGTALAVPRAQAGFGVSPPYFKNDQLTRGSRYEQTIYLVRDNPTEELTATAEINVPEAQSWIKIDKGNEFSLPIGQRQVPLVFSIDIPKGADFKEYKGAITIKTKSVNAPASGVVSIALGIQVDVDIKVVDQQIINFVVKSLKFLPTEEGRITKLVLKTENTGNVESAPSQVHVDFYDANDQNIVIALDNANTLDKIKPFTVGDIEAEFSTETLKQNSYWAHIKVMNGQTKIREEKINLTVYPKGSLPSAGVTVNWKLILGISLIVVVGIIFIGLAKGGNGGKNGKRRR